MRKRGENGSAQDDGDRHETAVIQSLLCADR